MAQSITTQKIGVGGVTNALYATNEAVTATTSATDFIVIPISGFRNFAVTMTTVSGGDISNVDIFGATSLAGTYTYSIATNIFSGSIAAGATGHYEKALTGRYLIVRVTSASSSVINLYVDATL